MVFSIIFPINLSLTICLSLLLTGNTSIPILMNGGTVNNVQYKNGCPASPLNSFQFVGMQDILLPPPFPFPPLLPQKWQPLLAQSGECHFWCMLFCAISTKLVACHFHGHQKIKNIKFIFSFLKRKKTHTHTHTMCVFVVP